jgi:glycosyltransferase involved in cell wall biosynthesis
VLLMGARREADALLAAPLTVVRPGAPLRVLEVIGNGIVGGMESCVLRLVERLPRERIELRVLCPFEGPFSDRVRAHGVACEALPMPDDPPWHAIQALCALIVAHGIDLLHAHLPNAHLLAALAGRLTGRPVLATIHGRQIGLNELEVHRLAHTHLCTVCRASELHALGLGIDPQRLSCIPNGVDTSLFTPAPAGVPASPRAAPQIGFVGRLSPEKGPELFVRTALLLRERLPDARLVMVGDGPMRPAVEDLIAQYRLGDHVRLAGERHDMPQAYRELDVLLSTSHSEAMPLAIMEAMASGVPVVATRVGGVPELVEHGGTGWLVAPGDADGLAGAVARLIQRPDEHARMAQRARARVVERFDLARQIDATSRLLQRLASARGTQVAGTGA